MTDDLDDIKFLKEPLVTDDGLLNPVCMAELGEVIESMPKTWQRLSDNSEWTEKRWVFRSEIVGALAMWACRQSPYGCPDGLENVCKYLNACLKQSKIFNQDDMAELSLCDINKLLHEILYEQGVKDFDAWNRCKVGKNPEISFSSRYDGKKDPDHDFIDLDALLHNVSLTIRDERRKNKAFDEKFEKEWNSKKL